LFGERKRAYSLKNAWGKKKKKEKVSNNRTDGGKKKIKVEQRGGLGSDVAIQSGVKKRGHGGSNSKGNLKKTSPGGRGLVT